MRTSFHHQPEAQHPNFPLSTSRQADYPIFIPESRQAAKISVCPLCAMNGLMHCNKRGGIGWLFNYLVGADKQPWRQGDAERPRGLEVDQ
jgi:hypothetical protein